MKLGIIGLPNVGKSTLFNSLTNSSVEASNYAFSTVNTNIGVANVPDERLNALANLYKTEKIIPSSIEFADIAGLVKGASKGEGLGNKFLSNIREVDALIHVVRCFEDPNVPHQYDKIDPLYDIETINLELAFADLEIIERRLAKPNKNVKNEDQLQSVLKKLKEELEEGRSARSVILEEDELFMIKEFNFLSLKPVLYSLNVSEDRVGDAEHPMIAPVIEFVKSEKSNYFIISAKIEDEISKLDENEKKAFLADLGIEKSGLEMLIKESFSLLGLTSFLTAGPKEVRAWTVKKGIKAPAAAGKIHSDLERGFIRAEVVDYYDLIKMQSYTLAKDRGLVRLEGKDYVIRENDVVLFRFNV